jgi:hypothetical protein
MLYLSEINDQNSTKPITVLASLNFNNSQKVLKLITE